MKYSVVLLLFSLAVFGCCDDDMTEELKCEPFLDAVVEGCDWTEQVYDGIVLPNKSLNLVWSEDRAAYLFSYKDSTTTVVSLWHSAGHCIDYSDDEWGQSLHFELPTGVTSFSYEDEELTALQCVHQESGAWISTSPAFVSEGKLVGNKLDNEKWSISVLVYLPNITSRGNKCISYQGDFIVQ